jgi:hypothetical protein
MVAPFRSQTSVVKSKGSIELQRLSLHLLLPAGGQTKNYYDCYCAAKPFFQKHIRAGGKPLARMLVKLT